MTTSYTHSAATLRVAQMLIAGGVRAVSVGDDVWTCPASDRPRARELLAGHPHFLYYLDRDIRATTYELGGCRAVVIHRGADTSLPPLALHWAVTENKTVETSVTLPNEIVEVVTTSPPRTMSIHAKFARYSSTGTAIVPNYDSPPEHTTFTGVEYQEAKFGGLVVGGTARFARTLAASADTQSEADLLNRPYMGFVPEGLSGDSYKFYASVISRSVRYGSALVMENPSKVAGEAKVNAVVLCGAPCVTYGEIYPGFAWMASDSVTLANRMKAVVQAAKTGTAAEKAKVLEKIDSFANDGAVLFSFRTDGSRDLDPVDFLPDVKKTIRSFGALRPDGENVTMSSLKRGLEDFYSRKWMLSAVKSSNVASAIMAQASAGTVVRLRPSSLTSLHLTDGAGTVNFDFDAALPVLQGLLNGGAVLEFVDSGFNTATGFDSNGWEELKSLRAQATSPNDDQTSAVPAFGTKEFANLFGEGLVARLALEKLFDANEEALVLPMLSPQFMWTQLARGSVPDVPLSDADALSAVN